MRIEREKAERIVEEALRRGASEAELFMVSSKSHTVDVKDQKVDATEFASEYGYALRVLRDKSLGFAFSTDISNWRDTVKRALELSRFTTPDEANGLGVSDGVPSPEIYDDSLSSLQEEEAIEYALQIEKEAYRDRRVKKTRKSSVSWATSEVVLLNSNGINLSYRGTSISGEITISAEEGGDSQMGWGYQASRSLRSMDFKGIGREALERATALLGAKRAPTVKAEVLMDSAVVVELLGVLSSAFSSENVQKGKSLLAGKKGQRVFSEILTILDDPTVDWAVGSRPFDAEGTASKRNVLVREGVLKQFLYNVYTARKDNTISTGNATRRSISLPPSVGISNFYIDNNGKGTNREDMISAIDRGLLVLEVMGVHTANPITGEFSIGANGIYIEKGKPMYPVKEAAISGTLFEIFSSVVALGKKLRFYGKIGAPEILFKGVNISG